MLFLRRPGGQSQFSAQLAVQAADRQPLRELQAWIVEHPGADCSVPALAHRVAMSPRNFARVFLREIGMTPAHYVERVRVEAARRRLEESTRRRRRDRGDCGFGTAETMRRAFLRQLRVRAERLPDPLPGGELRGAMRRTTRVGILVFDDVEVLDFCGPVRGVLGHPPRRGAAARGAVAVRGRCWWRSAPASVAAAGGLQVTPDVTRSTAARRSTCWSCPAAGARGARSTTRRCSAWIAERGRQVETLTSVCTGAMLLGHAGLLDGRRATTHWRSLDWMRRVVPRASRSRTTLHVVEDGNVLTSAGISAGIDMALRVVARYHGEADRARHGAAHGVPATRRRRRRL